MLLQHPEDPTGLGLPPQPHGAAQWAHRISHIMPLLFLLGSLGISCALVPCVKLLFRPDLERMVETMFCSLLNFLHHIYVLWVIRIAPKC